MYAMLLAPKIMGAFAAQRAGIKMADVGGVVQFLISLLAEIALSIAYAPVLMVQQSIAVLRTTISLRENWVPQRRQGGRYSLGVMLKFHTLETLMGILFVGGMTFGLVSLWLLPIAGSLLIAVPLSALSGVKLGSSGWTARQMGTPEHLNAPQIIRTAIAERKRLATLLDTPEVIAAE
jgi:membrane glycosyltransferase